MKMFNKKKNDNKQNTIVNDEVVANDVISKSEILDSKDVKSSTKKEKENTKKEPKSLCRILVATPSYFVIMKNGESVTINKKNNYHRGEEIYF